VSKHKVLKSIFYKGRILYLVQILKAFNKLTDFEIIIGLQTGTMIIADGSFLNV